MEPAISFQYSTEHGQQDIGQTEMPGDSLFLLKQPCLLNKYSGKDGSLWFISRVLKKKVLILKCLPLSQSFWKEFCLSDLAISNDTA